MSVHTEDAFRKFWWFLCDHWSWKLKFKLHADLEQYFVFFSMVGIAIPWSECTSRVHGVIHEVFLNKLIWFAAAYGSWTVVRNRKKKTFDFSKIKYFEKFKNNICFFWKFQNILYFKLFHQFFQNIGFCCRQKTIKILQDLSISPRGNHTFSHEDISKTTGAIFKILGALKSYDVSLSDKFISEDFWGGLKTPWIWLHNVIQSHVHVYYPCKNRQFWSVNFLN